jgi:hypothetical protein
MIRRDRDPIDDDATGFRLTTEPVRAPSAETRLVAAVALGIVVLAVAILKPWGWGLAEPSAPIGVAPAVPVVATSIPTEDRTAEGLAAPICLGTGGWRVISLETWRTQDVRVWRAIEPIEGASGPLDPAIPSVPIVALQLVALGWCAPAFGPDMPIGPADVAAWTVHGDVAMQIDLRQVRPIDGVTPIAALYVPLSLCPEPTICAPLLPSPEPRPWASERVVFRYRDVPVDRSVWFAADITILAPPTAPAAGPSATP